MSTCTSASQLKSFPRKLIGEILQEAGLISSPQLETALIYQRRSSHSKLGEIFVERGWLKQKTIDFLVDVFSRSDLHKYLPSQPIGYYLKEAGLLDEEQIHSIIEEQKVQKMKFCYLAVIKGFLRPKTADFFLRNVAEKFAIATGQNKSATEDKIEDLMLENSSYEEILREQDVNINLVDFDLATSDDLEIESTPVWIDYSNC